MSFKPEASHFATEEIEQLTKQTVPDKLAQERIITKVQAAIEDRKREAEERRAKAEEH